MSNLKVIYKNADKDIKVTHIKNIDQTASSCFDKQMFLVEYGHTVTVLNSLNSNSLLNEYYAKDWSYELLTEIHKVIAKALQS